MNETILPKVRYGMVIDLDRCTGCGNCSVACAVENNLPPAQESATPRNGIQWLQITEVRSNDSFSSADAVFIPMMCQQCGHKAPCVSVCPQNAVEVDPATGIVGQIPQRCFGCRYCMTACPYHARTFNWHDPEWPAGTERMLNPDVAPRMRGVAEKCSFCNGRYHAAMVRAAGEGRRTLKEGEYVPACVEACPAKAIVFGDLADASSTVATQARDEHAFRFLARLETESAVYFRSQRSWVRELAERTQTRVEKERVNG